MSGISSSLVLLTLLWLLLASPSSSWARPLDAAALNEVISQEIAGDEDFNNELMQQLPVHTGAIYQPRHAHLNPPQLRRSSLLRRLYKLPGPVFAGLAITPGGANYYNNEVLPLSTYEIIEPETIY